MLPFGCLETFEGISNRQKLKRPAAASVANQFKLVSGSMLPYRLGSVGSADGLKSVLLVVVVGLY